VASAATVVCHSTDELDEPIRATREADNVLIDIRDNGT
jgi:hypothetical protein